MKKSMILLLIAVLIMSLSTAWAQTKPWTTVGSAGTVDEEDTGIVSLGSPIPGAVMLTNVAIGTLNIRYNVVAVDGVFGGDNYALTVRFRDNGADARVIVRLKSYNFNTGTTRTLLTLDSNAYAAAAGFQKQTVSSNCGTHLDFFNNAYFMDVEITKAGMLAVPPALASIQLIFSIC